MQITEPMTMITDYVLAILTAYLGWLLFRAGRESGQKSVLLWSGAFIAIVVASIAGGTAHGFAPYLGSAKAVFWKLTVYSIGLASFFLVTGTIVAVLSRPLRLWLLALAVLGLAVYAAWMVTHDEFRYVIYYYAPSMLVVLALQVYAAWGLKERGAPWIIAGLLVAFAAAGIQQSGFALHRNFNHNDLYHVVQMVSFYLLYRGAILLKDA